MTTRRMCVIGMALAVLVGAGTALWVFGPKSGRPAVEPASPDAGPPTDSGHALPELIPIREEEQPETVRKPVESWSSVYLGSVQAPDGSPIEGAAVTFFPKMEGWRDQEPLGTTQTDASGAFDFSADALAGDVVLVASADGFAKQFRKKVQAGLSIKVVLPWSATIHGRVLERGTEDSVPDAIVSLRGESVVADSMGQYRLENVMVGRQMFVSASREGFVPVRIETRLEKRGSFELDLYLQRGFEIHAVVVDSETDEPIDAARIREHRATGEVILPTDDDGMFTLRVAEGVELSTLIEADGYASLSWLWEVHGTEFLDSPRIPMMRLATIEGIVLDALGEPLGQAGVDAESEGLRARRWDASGAWETARVPGLASYVLPGADGWPGSSSTRTDDSGIFTIAVVPTESPYFVQLNEPGYMPISVGPLVLDRPGGRTRVELRASAGAVIRGRLLRNGEPWSQGDVVWSDDLGRHGIAKIDLEGRYEIEDVPPGDIALRLRMSNSPGHGPGVHLQVEVNQVYEHNFEWEERLGTIKGNISSPAGGPLAGIRVRAIFDNGDLGVLDHQAKTNSYGDYSLEVIEGIPYDVDAYRPPVRKKQAGIESGTIGVDFVFSKVGRLQVKLVDSQTGQPVVPGNGDLWGMAWGTTGEGLSHTVRKTVGIDGRVSLDLPVGEVDLSFCFSDAGYAPRKLHGVHVNETTNPDPLLVELTRGVSLKVVLKADEALDRGSPGGHLFFLLEDSQLDLLRGPYPRQGGPSNHRINGINMWLGEPGLIQQMLNLDETGITQLAGLAPGTYRLRVYPDDFAFEPETFEVGSDASEIEVRWMAR